MTPTSSGHKQGHKQERIHILEQFKPNHQRRFVSGIKFDILEPEETLKHSASIDNSIHINLARPVFHPGYFNLVVSIFKAICKNCANLTLPIERRAYYNDNIICLHTENVDKKMALFDSIVKDCVKHGKCLNCKDKKGQPLKSRMTSVVKLPDHEGINLIKYGDTYTMTSSIYDLFKKIPQNDTRLLQPFAENLQPQHLLLTHIFIPKEYSSIVIETAKAAKAVVDDNGATVGPGQNHRPRTEELLYIINAISNEIRELDEKHVSHETTFLCVYKLQQAIDELLDNKTELPGNLGIEKDIAEPIVGWSANLPVVPDPSLGLNQVGVPREVAMQLTQPEQLNDVNLENQISRNRIREAILTGPNNYPGATFLENGGEPGSKKSLAYKCRMGFDNQIKSGFILTRHMIDDDIVLIGEPSSTWSPSLNKTIDMTSHRVKVHNDKAIKMNPFFLTSSGISGSVNLHFPQTVEARSEAYSLMNGNDILVSPLNASFPKININQCIIECCKHLTRKDTTFEHSAAQAFMSRITGAIDTIKLPSFSFIHNHKFFFSGKQMFSCLMDTRINVILETDPSNESKLLVIRYGQLTEGQIDERALSVAHYNNLFAQIKQQTGSTDKVKQFVNRLTKLPNAMAELMFWRDDLNYEDNDTSPHDFYYSQSKNSSRKKLQHEQDLRLNYLKRDIGHELNPFFIHYDSSIRKSSGAELCKDSKFLLGLVHPEADTGTDLNNNDDETPPFSYWQPGSPIGATIAQFFGRLIDRLSSNGKIDDLLKLEAHLRNKREKDASGDPTMFIILKPGPNMMTEFKKKLTSLNVPGTVFTDDIIPSSHRQIAIISNDMDSNKNYVKHELIFDTSERIMKKTNGRYAFNRITPINETSAILSLHGQNNDELLETIRSIDLVESVITKHLPYKLGKGKLTALIEETTGLQPQNLTMAELMEKYLHRHGWAAGIKKKEYNINYYNMAFLGQTLKISSDEDRIKIGRRIRMGTGEQFDLLFVPESNLNDSTVSTEKRKHDDIVKLSW